MVSGAIPLAGLAASSAAGPLTPTVIVNDAVAVDGTGVAESVTSTVTTEDPTAFAVPLMTPSPSSVRPSGSVPETMLQLYGATPPVAVSCVE